MRYRVCAVLEGVEIKLWSLLLSSSNSSLLVSSQLSSHHRTSHRCSEKVETFKIVGKCIGLHLQTTTFLKRKKKRKKFLLNQKKKKKSKTCFEVESFLFRWKKKDTNECHLAVIPLKRLYAPSITMCLI